MPRASRHKALTKTEIKIWNAAIDAAIARLKLEFVEPTVVVEIINRVKK